MGNMNKRVLSLMVALALCLSLLPGLSGAVTAATVNYVTGYVNSEYGTAIKNWGERGTVATFLSPNAEAFYEKNNVTYEDLSALSGASSTSSVPSSALYQELNELVTNNQTMITSYSDTKELFQFTDCQGSGISSSKISSFYSGKEIGPSWDGTWNREHTWPNSKGDANGQGEDDIMMLRPTSTSENSSRSNKAYGESAGFYHPNSESDGTYDLRGDVARIMLYVYTRWGTQNMWGTDGVIESKEILLKWMQEDPVDTWEMGRNDSTESIIGTRNVYVDYPELAYCLFNEEVPADMETPSGEAANSSASYTITAIPNNSAYGTVSVNGRKITAFPNAGYYIDGYTIVSGEATVSHSADVFTVTAASDCTVQINFKARTAVTYRFAENNQIVSTVNGYLGDIITLPGYTGTVPEGYAFQGWVTASVADVTEEPVLYKEGSKYTLNANVTFHALFSWFNTEDGVGQNGLFTKFTGDIEEGDYLLIANGGAMNTTVTNTRLQFTSVTITEDAVNQPAADLIWHIESTEDGYYTLYNEAGAVYAASTGAKNKATTITSVTDNAKWSISVDAKGNWVFTNKANNEKGINDTLLRNADYGFACYASNFNNGVFPALYKTAEGAMHYTTSVGTEPIEPETVLGDMTGDSKVNNEDVLLLLWNTLFPTEYPLNVSGDINKDGEVNNADVVKLLWHALFPEDCPL